IPAGLPSGQHYMIAKADVDGLVVESSDANKFQARFFYVGPDLAIFSLTAPVAAAAGASISIADVVKNQGGSSAAASTTRFYFSTNGSIDAGDVLLDGSRAVPALAANGTSSGSVAATIPPSSAAGFYYII